MKPKTNRKLTYDEQNLKLQQFIKNFEDFSTQNVHQIYGRKKYLIQLQNIADGLSKSFQVEIQDAQEFLRKEDEKVIISGLLHNTERYVEMFTQIAERLMPQRRRAVDPDQQIQEKYDNILKQHRSVYLLSQQSLFDKNEKLPTEIHKKYSVSIIYGNDSKLHVRSLSQLKSDQIGGLIATKAIVIRISEVKPQISVATYACDICGCENYQQITDISYNPLTVCQSKKCRENKVSGKLIFLSNHSKFRPYQQVKIQQTPDQLRPGQVPISKSLILRGNCVKSASPGDIILIQGVLVPSRKLGWGQFDLKFNCHIQGYKILREKKKYVQWQLSPQQKQKVYSKRKEFSEEQLFDQLSQAIAPQIFGMQYVKKSLLLMMAGGVTKQTVTDNLKIRGEINIALIGDPGIAKSQLLKKISVIAPRAIYTTGKGSSDVGLTAAIVKDQKTKQIALQAGALVLADMGICCIDEFDKMDQYDRTAIHEAMQQQTISIAKAGITTTLNARTSILAAANPLYGRYNRSQTPHKNINLPAALLSRFDLVFILLDKPDEKKDLDLAYHICRVHMNQKAPENENFFDTDFLRTYIAMAKEYQPVISNELHSILIKKYVEKRKLQTDLSKEGETYTTTRSLLALIRLCMARAKLRFSNQVNEDDLAVCLQIMEKSQQGVLLQTQTHRKYRTDDMSEIFNIIKYMCLYSQIKTASISEIKKKVYMKGYTDQQLQIVLKNYENLNVIDVRENEVVLIE